MYKAVVVGVSMGGMHALQSILSGINQSFSLPLLIVQHQSAQYKSNLAELLNRTCPLTVVDACSGDVIQPNHVYIAPAGYHLLVEKDKTIALSVDNPVNYSIPSIDVLFESAAEAYKETLIGVVLTGANHDGSQGLKTIKTYGGLTVVQDPKTAEAAQMPTSAINLTQPAHIVPLDEISDFLNKLCTDNACVE